MRKFEKISEKQWDNDIVDYIFIDADNPKYIDILLPKRGTKKSAGYDFFSPINIVIPAHSTAKIPTGIKVAMEDDEILMIFPRSSIGFKTNIRLSNTVGIIDSDYYNNVSNEGHMWIKFYNPSDTEYEIKIGDKIAQGIFTKFLITDDDNADGERNGGLGSTGK